MSTPSPCLEKSTEDGDTDILSLLVPLRKQKTEADVSDSTVLQKWNCILISVGVTGKVYNNFPECKSSPDWSSNGFF